MSLATALADESDATYAEATLAGGVAGGIGTVAITEGGLTSAGTSVPVTLPGSGSASDLYVVVLAMGATAATLNALTDWAESLDENAAGGIKVVRYTGSGVPSNPTFVTSASTRTQWAAFRIPGADKTVAPQIGTTATGTSSAGPNPPAVTPTGGVSKEYLSIVVASGSGAVELADNDTWVTTFPTNYTDTQAEKTGGTTGTNLGGLLAVASRKVTTGAAVDPGIFSLVASYAWRAQHILIHPVAATPSATGVARLSLAPATTPTVDTGHALKARVAKASGSGDVTFTLSLYEGANNRSGDLTTSPVTTSFAAVSLPIAAVNAADITDYSNLEVRVKADSPAGENVAVRIARLELEVPPGEEGTAHDPGTIGDTAGVSDSLSIVVGSVRAIGDTAGVADSATPAAAYARGVADTAGVADAAVDVEAYARTVDDTAGVADSAQAGMLFSPAIDDSVGVSDTGGGGGPASYGGTLGQESQSFGGGVSSIEFDTEAAVPEGGKAVFGVYWWSQWEADATVTVDGVAADLELQYENPANGGNTRVAQFSVPGPIPLGATVEATFSDDSWHRTIAGVYLDVAGEPTDADVNNVDLVVTSDPPDDGSIIVMTGWIDFGASQTFTPVAGSTVAYDFAHPLGDGGRYVIAYREVTSAGSYGVGGSLNGGGAQTALAIAYGPGEGGGGGVETQVGYGRPTDDTVGVADAAASNSAYSRAVNDTAGVADGVSPVTSYARLLSDTALLNDAAQTAASKLVGLADTAGVADAANSSIILPVAIGDVLGLADQLASASALVRAIQDTVSVADQTGVDVTVVKGIADSLGLTDAITSAIARLNTLSDALAAADALTRTSSWVRTLADTAGVTDAASPSAAGQWTQNVSDTLNVSDEFARLVTHNRTVADTLGLNDVLSPASARLMLISDQVDTFDTLALTANIQRAIEDTLTAADVALTTATRELVLQDAVELADAIVTGSAAVVPVRMHVSADGLVLLSVDVEQPTTRLTTAEQALTLLSITARRLDR